MLLFSQHNCNKTAPMVHGQSPGYYSRIIYFCNNILNDTVGFTDQDPVQSFPFFFSLESFPYPVYLLSATTQGPLPIESP